MFGLFFFTKHTVMADFSNQSAEEALDLADQNSMYDRSTLSGLGFGINVLTAESLSDFKTAYTVLNYSDIEDLNTTRINLNQSYSSSFMTTDAETLAASFEGSLSASSGLDIFLFNFGQQIKANAAFNYSNYVFKYYNTYYINIYKYNSFINNYLSSSTYSNRFSTDYLNDLQALSNNTLSYENFFGKYGTHLVGSALFGGKLYATYSLLSNSAVMNMSNEVYINDAVSLTEGLSDYNIRAGVASVLNAQSSLTLGASSFTSNFSVSCLGGNYSVGANLSNFDTNCDMWCGSFDNENASVVVDYTNDGLVPLWDILPANYISLSTAMENAYISLSATAHSAFINDFKTGNYASFAGGNGSPQSPFLITNATQLRNIESASMSSCYKLSNNITLSQNTEWVPLGGFYKQTPFLGTLDGDGYAIYNLTRTTDISEYNNRIYFGLFGYIGKDERNTGYVKNLVFRTVNIAMSGPAVNNASTKVLVGVLAGIIDGGTVENVAVRTGSCSYNCCTNGISYVGGICGILRNGSMSSCLNKIAITSGRYGAYAGGLIGYCYHSSVVDCSNTGTIQTYCTGWQGTAASGGIIGAYCNNSYYPNYLSNNTNTGSLYANYYSWAIVGCTLLTAQTYGQAISEVFD